MKNQKIDFVMIWVDGNDKEWQKEKAKYSPNKNTDSRNIRYRDWDNLKYWFRGVEKYAPWVNKIYFVTCGHLPEWLNTSNPKLVCIKHSDYMPEEYLPTFSSHPIELNLHRIKDLSEQFVYFNDDTFIFDKIKPTDFFKNGKPRAMCIFQPTSGIDEVFVTVKNNVNLVINRHFSKKEIIKNNLNKYLNIRYGKYNLSTLCCLPFSRIQGFHESHHGNPYLKSTFEKVWKEEYELLNETSKHKFRSSSDVNQYIFEHWQFCEGNFIPKKNQTKIIRVLDNVDEAVKEIKRKKVPMICLNDGESSSTDFEQAKEKINKTLEELFPEKSSFEK